MRTVIAIILSFWIALSTVANPLVLLSGKPPVAGGTLVTDDFNRTAGTLGANWTQGGDSISTQGSYAQLTGETKFGTSRWTADSFANNQYCKLTLIDLGSNGSSVELVVRGDGAGATQDGYALQIRSNGTSSSTTASLELIVDDDYTTLDTDSSTWSEGDVIEIRVSGTSITTYKNAILVSGFSATDSTLTIGVPGINIYNVDPGTVTQVDNFEGGDL